MRTARSAFQQQNQRGGALGSSRSRGLFYVAVPAWLSSAVRRTKSFLLATLICLSFLSTGYAQVEKRFGSIVVRDDKFGTARPRNEFLIDFDSAFAWMNGERRDSGTNATSGVFVFSKPHRLWIQIAKVSTAGARFGKSSQWLVSQPWDFTSFVSNDFVPLPIPGLVPPYPGKHCPDGVTFDEARETFVLHFDSFNTLESERTTVLVPKKDLTEAFDYFARPKLNTPDNALEPTATAPSVSTNK